MKPVPQNFKLCQRFFFDAAHTLNRDIEVDASRRIHGHTYHVDICLTGAKDPNTGLVIDLGHLRAAIVSLRNKLDHRLLDEVEELGAPTLENLCSFIWAHLIDQFDQLSAVTVRREGIGDACTLTLD